jgi:hypothetical protein
MTIHHSRSRNRPNSHSRNQRQNSQGQRLGDHIIRDVTKTHVVIHRSYLKRLQNKESQIDELHQLVRKKYTGTPLSKRLLASAWASVPGLSLTGSELVIPLVVATFLADLHLIDDQKIDFRLFSKSFASSRNLRDILISFAVDSLIKGRKSDSWRSASRLSWEQPKSASILMTPSLAWTKLPLVCNPWWKKTSRTPWICYSWPNSTPASWLNTSNGSKKRNWLWYDRMRTFLWELITNE